MERRLPPLRPGSALRAAWRERGPGWLRADLLAGCTVGVVALPLSMALAIASGAPPEAGLATAVVAGALVALLGGSRFQVTGPTAAFVAVLVPVVARHGLGGLALATCMAGGLLVGLALLRLGRLVQYVPYPVTTGFTAGIAVVIATLQVQGLLDLRVEPIAADAHFAERAAALARALPSASWSDGAVGLATLAALLAWPRRWSRIPSPLVGLLVGVLAAELLRRAVPGSDVATLAGRFGTPEHPSGLPRSLPLPGLPWEGLPSLALVRELLPASVTIALLAGIESLLSAVVADAQTGTQHDPDAELLALGLGNLVAPLFGGIAATGALARTATNVRSGARTPWAAVFHALFVLLAVLVFAPALGRLPLASLAALLLVVAWNMAELPHVLRVLRRAPRGDAAVLAACFALTVLVDMTAAVLVGIVLAALLFMRRMVELTEVRLYAAGAAHGLPHELPPGVAVYELAGPLFFGAAHKATGLLRRLAPDLRVLVLDLSGVPAIDASGLFNLESALERLRGRGVRVRFAGVRPQPLRTLRRAGLLHAEDEACADVAAALASLEAGLPDPAAAERARAGTGA